MIQTSRRRTRQRSLRATDRSSPNSQEHGPPRDRALPLGYTRPYGDEPTLGSTPAIEAFTIPAWKRAFDLSFIMVVLPLVLLLGLLVAGWVRLVSPGSVIFRQERVGRGGKRFTIYKFRSMHVKAPTQAHERHVERLILANKSMTKLDLIGDERLIPGGCLLRTSGLDELPQLWNVLKGEMSLVGPRPCLNREFELHNRFQCRRFRVQPGITGAAQVGRHAESTFRDLVRLDVRYTETMSVFQDLAIVLRTPAALARQATACFRAKVFKSVPSDSLTSAPEVARRQVR